MATKSKTDKSKAAKIVVTDTRQVRKNGQRLIKENQEWLKKMAKK